MNDLSCSGDPAGSQKANKPRQKSSGFDDHTGHHETTVLAAVVPFSGLFLGVLRLNLVKRYSEGRFSPFRGWMPWHHLLGLIGGITLFTWVGTAFIYMRPNH